MTSRGEPYLEMSAVIVTLDEQRGYQQTWAEWSDKGGSGETKVGDPDARQTHIGKSLMNRITPDVQLRWRERLRRKCRIVLQPGEGTP
jgi:hypothetical protein